MIRFHPRQSAASIPSVAGQTPRCVSALRDRISPPLAEHESGIMPGMKVIDRIKTAVEEARREGGHPRRVHLTVDDGRKLQVELIEQGGKLGHKVVKEGIRHAVHRIQGVEVVWRSPEFRVT